LETRFRFSSDPIDNSRRRRQLDRQFSPTPACTALVFGAILFRARSAWGTEDWGLGTNEDEDNAVSPAPSVKLSKRARTTAAQFQFQRAEARSRIACRCVSFSAVAVAHTDTLTCRPVGCPDTVVGCAPLELVW
jgi:hypothetical protein